MLSSWNDGAARRAVVEFVESTVAAGVPGSERVAVFDNDGTLCCEKPMPIQADFILRRLAEMARADPGLHDRQPWKAAHERDFGWFARCWPSTMRAMTPMWRRCWKASSPPGPGSASRIQRRRAGPGASWQQRLDDRQHEKRLGHRLLIAPGLARRVPDRAVRTDAHERSRAAAGEGAA
jgi:hypothetical protein